METLQADLSGLLGVEVQALERIGRQGKNSRVYALSCADGRRLVAKVYARDELVLGDRIAAESWGLSFLRRNGVLDVPAAVAADRERGLAVYEYVEGGPVPADAVSEGDVDAAVDCLARMAALVDRPGADDLPRASEACFSLREVRAGLDLRLGRLRGVEEQGEPYAALRTFLKEELEPALAAFWARATAGHDVAAELPRHERTLSPSDFGFHNALRRPDGGLVWLDFEYFGWDDPAKTVVDFVLHPHPGMAIPDALRVRFVEGMFARFDDHPYLPARVEIVYPLWALKWCFIMLNEFVPEHLARRAFVGLPGSVGDVQMQQLAKARSLLQRIQSQQGAFPYRG